MIHLKAHGSKATRTTHGLTYDPLYQVWQQIKQRCLNPRDPSYEDYGGRGITVQESWIHDFVRFYAYATSLPGYDFRIEYGFEIDRVNNEEDYREGNLRWATRVEQNKNRRVKTAQRRLGLL